MNEQHSQTIANHLLATGEQMVINGETVVGKKRLLTFKDSSEITLLPEIVAYRISAPKEGMEFVPRRRSLVVVDGEEFSIGGCVDLGFYYRFDIWRYVA